MNIFFILSFILIFQYINSSSNDNNSKKESKLDTTIKTNLKNITSIHSELQSYTEKNSLFELTKQQIKSLTHGNELFQEEFTYLTNDNPNKYYIYDEGLEHRLTPETLFEYESNINCFNFITTKSITKDDTGHFISTLLLLSQKTKIVVTDLLGNVQIIYDTHNEIENIITFKQNDRSDFYLIFKNKNLIKKYTIIQGIFYHTNSNNTNINNDTITTNSSEENIIDIDTFAEDDKRERVDKLSYKLYDSYKESLRNRHIEIIEEKKYFFKLNKTNEYITDVTPATIKGTKYLIISTNKMTLYQIDIQNLEIISYTEILNKDKNLYSYELSPFIMTSYYIIFLKSQKGFVISTNTNSSNIIGNCMLFPENTTEKIIHYFFDQQSRRLYALSSNFFVYLISPMIIQNSGGVIPNSCRILILGKLNHIYNETNYYIFLLHKKLMVTSNGKDYEIIDLTRVEEYDPQKSKTKILHLNQVIDNKIYSMPLIWKNQNEYYFLHQIKENALLLYKLHEKNSKIYTSESQSFNFKVPIILVAFVLILVWNYLQKKNEGNGTNVEHNNQYKFGSRDKKMKMD